MPRLFALLALLAIALPVARADVAPSPGRPEWDETPMPMPDEAPVEIAVVLLGVALVAARGARSRASA
jgi:hypothetical protein